MYSISLEQIEKDGRTTVMLRNIPNKYTRDMILEEIDAHNFKKKYDFFYLPIDYRVLSLFIRRISAMWGMLLSISSIQNSSGSSTTIFT